MALIKPEQLRSGSYEISGSFSGSFQGNGSGLNNITASLAPNYVLTSSYIQDSSSFDIRILNNSSSIDTLSGSFIGFSGSYLTDSASFDTRIQSNSSSIDLLSGSFDSFSQTYNTGSFSGSFTGSLFGTASWAVNAQTASYVLPLNQDVLISGSLKLDPTQDPDPAGLDLDSTVLFQSSSNTTLGYDLYIRQNGNLVKWKWIEGILETGLLYGGAVTYSGSNVFVSPGSGIIVDHNATTGSEISPIVEYVTWPAITQSITNIATQQVTYLYIDNTGALQQQSTRFTSQQYHDYIPLGAVGHFDYTQVSAFGGQVQTAYDQISQILNFVDAFGPLKMSGYGLTGQAGSLRLSVGSGTSFIHGGFYQNDPEFPSQITTPSQATASLARVYRSGSSVIFDTNAGNLYTTVNPTVYDRDGDGTLANVGNGNWSIQRVFSDPKTGVLYIYYGQERYTTLLNALQYLPTDPFVEGDTFDFTTFLGYLVLRGNASDLTDTNNNSIINGGLFRGSGQGSGGGVAISNLDDLTDVSITGPTNGEALIYDSGIWQNGVPLNATSASYATQALSSSFAISSSQSVSSSFSSTASFVPGYVSGSGSASQVSFWTGTNSQSGDSGLIWDNTNKRLGVGTSAPATNLTIQQGNQVYSPVNLFQFEIALGLTSNSALISGMDFKNFNSSGQVRLMARNDQNDYIAVNVFGSSNSATFFGQTGNNISSIFSQGATDTDKILAIGTFNNGSFILGTNNAERMRIFAGGNVAINTTTDAGFRLDVNGTTRLNGNTSIGGSTAGARLDVRAQGALSTDIAFRVRNSADNANLISVAGNGNTTLTPSDNTTALTVSGYNLTGTNNQPVINLAGVSQHTSGTVNTINSAISFVPSSGNGEFNVLGISPIIRQLGGANGITRGLFVNPSLIIFTDWRSIEWTNNTGFGLYGAGGAPNYLSGSLGIGTTSPTARLQVRGSGATSATTALRVENTNASASLVVLDNGTVGIGTTTPSQSLDVNGNIRVQSIYGGGTNNLYFFTDANAALRTSMGGMLIGSSYDSTPSLNEIRTSLNQNLSINSRGSGSIFFQTTDTTRVTISGSNVGIGTTTPSSSLHISGASSANLFRIDSPASSSILFVSGSGNIGIGTTTPAFPLTVNGSAQVIGTLFSSTIRTTNLQDSISNSNAAINFGGNSKFIQFVTDTIERMRITSTGNIGIGTTTPTSASLTVNGNVWALSYTGSFTGSVAAPGSTTQIVYNNGGVLGADSGFVYSGSRVGIGTTTPTDNLHIRQDQNGVTQIRVENVTNDTNSRASIGVGSAGDSITMARYLSNYTVVPGWANKGAILTDSGLTGGFFFRTTAGPIAFQPAGNTDRVVFAANGTVGIGTTTPSASLHISGASSAALLEIDSPAVNNILFVSGSGQIGFNQTSSTAQATFKSLINSDVSEINTSDNGAYGFRTSGIIKASSWFLYGSAGYLANASGVSILYFDSSRNVGLNVSSSLTSKFQVRGSGTTSATTTFRVENASALPSLTITDDLNSQFYGNVGIRRAATASLDVAGTTRISGSFNTAISGSILTVQGSGSAQPIFTVQGSQGELFSITDSLSGSLFSVNDISGLPILEVFSDNTTLIGNYQDPMLITTAKVVQTNSGSFTVYSLPTESYDTAFFEYSVRSGSNARAGTIMAMQLGSTVNFTETTTTDFGSTSAVSFTVIVTGSNMALTGSSTSGAWTIKTIVRGI